MILDLAETREWLRDNEVSESTLQMLINAAELYLNNATGKGFDSENDLAKLFCLVLVTDWNEDRQMVGKVSEKVRFTVDSILAQLQYCEKEGEEV
ncbi:MAG TPA: phage gp6-like head-tail connector protein [Desulfitobacterium dehalogenans]|uniref:Phage gp6-like head-tail connector protein n=1 Tax=Desulfitobacterium dehalogenans TaxID=36854 RepID=A0A7C6Z6S5_9FIRM|nr:phage gp6-like head-tail connector protein [Desulfitobacterium dehalogenans]